MISINIKLLQHWDLIEFNEFLMIIDHVVYNVTAKFPLCYRSCGLNVVQNKKLLSNLGI